MKNDTLKTIRSDLQIWSLVLQDLKWHYGEDMYYNWFSKISLVEIIGGKEILMSAPTEFIRDWIKSQYINVILNYFQKHNSDFLRIDIITSKESDVANNVSDDENIVGNPKISIQKGKDYQYANLDLGSHLDSRLTFDNFVTGSPNELAYAAAFAVAEAETAIPKSNPLFLYGGVGLGKTHLMHAIAWHVHHNNPDRKVLYISAEKFMYSFIKALRNKDIMSFKEEFRSVDLLMIDDIQFICGKDSTQEEFFHTFNAIIDNNKQMVISCDRSPSDLDNIEDRIKSRLGWGLVADVHSTTYELRLGILEAKIEQIGAKVPRKIVNFLAEKIISNVRELEGALNKVVAFSSLIGKEMTLEATQTILSDLLRSHGKNITIENIKEYVASRYNIKISDMSSSSRIRSVARPRQIAIYISKHLTDKSLSEISGFFGKKDHTTILHAVKKIEELIHCDHLFKNEVSNLISAIETNKPISVFA